MELTQHSSQDLLVSIFISDRLEAVVETYLGETTGGSQNPENSLEADKTLTATSYKFTLKKYF